VNLWTVGYADPRLTASAVPYGQAGENTMRFPHLVPTGRRLHKPHSTPQQDGMNLILGNGETVKPAASYRPSSLPEAVQTTGTVAGLHSNLRCPELLTLKID
jgi:hypothetical protein